MKTPNVMAGTLLPEQMAQKDMMQMIVEALRQPGGFQSSAAPQMGLASASAGPANPYSTFDTKAIGGAIGNGINNLQTANTYGTTPFSQQTNMLAAQDAAFK